MKNGEQSQGCSFCEDENGVWNCKWNIQKGQINCGKYSDLRQLEFFIKNILTLHLVQDVLISIYNHMRGEIMNENWRNSKADRIEYKQYTIL